jgi:hypothetical protein
MNGCVHEMAESAETLHPRASVDVELPHRSKSAAARQRGTQE